MLDYDADGTRTENGEECPAHKANIGSVGRCARFRKTARVCPSYGRNRTPRATCERAKMKPYKNLSFDEEAARLGKNFSIFFSNSCLRPRIFT